VCRRGGTGDRGSAEAATLAARLNLLFHAFERLDCVRHKRWQRIHRDGQEEDEQPPEYPHTAASYHEPHGRSRARIAADGSQAVDDLPMNGAERADSPKAPSGTSGHPPDLH
jgi:hypothetical protein